MLFNKKSDEETKCSECKSKISAKYNFCPHCGVARFDIEKEIDDFGMLGRDNRVAEELMKNQSANNNLNLTDKMFMSIFNNLMKNLAPQMKELENGGFNTLPNGIKIKIGIPQRRKANRPHTISPSISAEQLEKMNNLPRTSAKTNIRRLGDKIIYELNTPGLESAKDVFVSKLESGYEIKAIGNKKVYINSLPISLPISKFAIDNDKLLIEFNAFEDGYSTQ